MQVNFIGEMRKVAGGARFNEPNFLLISELLEHVAKKYGTKMREKLLDKEGMNLAYGIIVLVNGRNIVHLQGLDTTLNKDDTVIIMPMSQGG